MTKEELDDIKLNEENERAIVLRDLSVSKTIKFSDNKGYILSTLQRANIARYDIQGSWREEYLLNHIETVKKPSLFKNTNKTIVPVNDEALSQNFSLIYSTSAYASNKIINQRKIVTANTILEFSIKNMDSTFVSIALENGSLKEEAIIVFDKNLIPLHKKLRKIRKKLGLDDGY